VKRLFSHRRFLKTSAIAQGTVAVCDLEDIHTAEPVSGSAYRVVYALTSIVNHVASSSQAFTMRRP
jgi:hypothetical protein